MSRFVTFASPVIKSELSIDFLRLTTEIDDDVTEWLRPIRHAMDIQRLDGWKVRAYQISDMQGVLVGQGAWLKNKTHALAEMRGELAERTYTFYTEKKGKATRIDLALTVWLGEYDHAIATNVHEMATRFLVESGRAERRRMPVIFGGVDGWTCYLGSRKSDRFFRVYDKDKQSGEMRYKNAWRFEIEIKGKVAQNLWERLRRPETRGHIIQSEIVAFLESYGLALKGFNATFASTKTGQASQPSDVKRKLEWLQSQVRPTVTDLIERGFANEAYFALDLPMPDLRDNNES